MFNYLFAKKHGGDFILRIEDTDNQREVEGATDYVLDSLEWIGIKPDEGFGVGGNFGSYKQSERLDIYKKYALELVENGFAYYAFDSADELNSIREQNKTSKIPFIYNYLSRVNLKNSISLSADEVSSRLKNGDPYVIRFKMPRDYNVSFNDIIRGNVLFNTDKLDDKVLFKSDGYPSYHLANVVDDHLMEISHVIRAEEWLPSTPLHILLYKAFGWDLPFFCHLPLVLGPDKQKLSKRHASKYNFPIFPFDWDYLQNGVESKALGFRDAGYESKALINYLVLLGWNPGNDIEYMSLDEMVNLFDLERVNKSGAVFDINKLKSVNSHYVKNLNYYTAVYMLGKYRNENNPMVDIKYGPEKTIKIVDMAKERAVFSKDLYSNVSFFFEPIFLADDVLVKNSDEFSEVMDIFLLSVNDIDWSADVIKYVLNNICDEKGFKLGKILPDLRLALTGGVSGPDLPNTMEVLGKNVTVERIISLLKTIKNNNQ